MRTLAGLTLVADLTGVIRVLDLLFIGLIRVLDLTEDDGLIRVRLRAPALLLISGGVCQLQGDYLLSETFQINKMLKSNSEFKRFFFQSR